MRESPAVMIMEKLRDLGARIDYSDPHVPIFPKMRKHYFDLSSITLTRENLAACDCVVLATDHDRFDYELIRAHAPLIVDSRGKYLIREDHIVKA
jgi:UDP-N-acetyl-D-glucosamine dehydrogenase